MRFTKLHGLGNDYLYVDCFAESVEDPPSVARATSDRHRGVGSDGLILLLPSEAADVRMEVYNADGSRARMCGNGIRCLAKFAYERQRASANPMRIETDSGVLEASLTVENGSVAAVRVDMGRPSLEPADIPCTLDVERLVDHPLVIAGRTYQATCVCVGSPHVVAFVDDLASVDLHAVGPLFENAAIFPDRINAHFASAVAADRVLMKTWERGSGVTQACGTGASAVCVAGAVTGRSGRRITAVLPGGELELDWDDNDHVWMTGPAVEVFSGDW